jgi:hypothetical protein
MEFNSHGDQRKLSHSFFGNKLKTSKRVLRSLGGFIESFFGNPTFSFFARRVRGWAGRFFVNKYLLIENIIAGQQILSSRFLGYHF